MKKIISIIVSIIAIISILLISIVNKLDTFKVESPIYYFSFDEKLEFTDVKIKNSKEKSVLKSEKEEVELSSVPLYYKGESKIFLAKDIGVVNYETGQINKIEHFSNIIVRNGKSYVEYYSEEKELSTQFLYDGEDTYVFLNSTNIKIGETTITVSPLSYVKFVNGGNSMEVYSKDDDIYTLIDIIDKDVNVEFVGGSQINLKLDILKNRKGELLLFKSLESLSVY